MDRRTGTKDAVSPPLALASRPLASLALALALGTQACELPPSFGTSYRNSNTNFIAAHPLSAPPPASDDGSTVALDAGARWDWAWRGKTGAGNAFAYMSLTDAGSVGAAVSSGAFTLPADAASWRLELVNLAGDPYLEGHAVGSTPAGWVVGDTAAPNTPYARVAATTPTSHGQTMNLVSYLNEWAGFDPNTPSFILDSPASYPSSRYRLRAWSQKASISFIIDSNISPNFPAANSSAIGNGKHSFDLFSVTTSSTRFMTGPATDITQDIALDDLRVVRDDIEESAKLRLLLSPSDTEPGLVSGRYEFSLWVRRPAGALAYDDSGRIASPEAPFATKKVSLAIRQVDFLVDRVTPIFFQETFDVGAEWTRIALRMGDGNLDRFDESSTEPVIELSVYPFDRQDIEPGSVLIAQPQLRFFIDGYTE